MVLTIAVIGCFFALCAIFLIILRFVLANQDVRTQLRTIDKSVQKGSGKLIQAEGRQYLESLLDLKAGALPPLGGFAASADFLIIVAEYILLARPAIVVEFGCGATTLVVARCLQLNGGGRLISYEHDAVFSRITQARAARLGLQTDIRTVPLESGSSTEDPGQWYRTDGLPERVDCAIVDGPPSAIHPETRSSAGTVLFPRLSPGGAFFLDDADRPGERRCETRWRAAFPGLEFTRIQTEKGTLVVRCP
jgi:hypothetical protein